MKKKLDLGDINSLGPDKHSDGINTPNVRHPKYSFGKEKRVMDKNNGNPGPGNYMHKEYTGKEDKKITKDLKFKSKSMEYFPGPGQYKTDNYNSIIKKLLDIKIGIEKRFSTSNLFVDNPGPRQYNNEYAK